MRSAHIYAGEYDGGKVAFSFEPPLTMTLDGEPHADSAESIIEAFEAVGTSRPVTLTPEQKGTFLELIEFWDNQNPGGLKTLPEGVFELRNALHDDLHDARESG